MQISPESAIMFFMTPVYLEELHKKGALSSRTFALLRKAGYQTLQEIQDLSPSALLELKLGTLAMEELNRLIRQYETDAGSDRVVFWKPEYVRSIEIADLTDGRYATVGAIFDAIETEYVDYADLCAVYRFLQQNRIPDSLLPLMRRRLIQTAPSWILELEINWDHVRPRLSRALKRNGCKVILDLIDLEKKPDIELDSVERVELKNLIDTALTQTRA